MEPLYTGPSLNRNPLFTGSFFLSQNLYHTLFFSISNLSEPEPLNSGHRTLSALKQALSDEVH